MSKIALFYLPAKGNAEKVIKKNKNCLENIKKDFEF